MAHILNFATRADLSIRHACGSKGGRISGNFAENWSGRWESNPRPLTANLLNILTSLSIHGSNWVQVQCAGDVSHSLLGDASAKVDVSKRSPHIGVAELFLGHFGRISGIGDERRDRMSEGMQSASLEPERIQNRPELIFNNLVR